MLKGSSQALNYLTQWLYSRVNLMFIGNNIDLFLADFCLPRSIIYWQFYVCLWTNKKKRGQVLQSHILPNITLNRDAVITRLYSLDFRGIRLALP